MFRLLLKFCDPVAVVCDNHAEAARFLDGNRHRSNGDIGVIGFVIIQHHFVIHLIDVIAGKDEHVVRIVGFHIFQVLIDGIGGSRIPVTAFASLIRRKNRNASHIPVQIPRNADPDMSIQTKRLILGEHTHRIHAGINAVAQGKIDDTVLSPKRYRRLCYLRCQNTEATSLPSCQ